MNRKRWILILMLALIGGLFFVAVKQYKNMKPASNTMLAIHGNPDFRLRLANPGFQLKEAHSDSSQPADLAEMDITQKNWIVYHEQEQVGTLTFEKVTFQPTHDDYYFLRYRPLINLDQPLHIQAAIGTRTKDTLLRHIRYPQDSEQPTIANSAWSQERRLQSGEEMPKHSLYLDGEDFSFHLSMVNVYELLGNGVRKELYHEAVPSRYTANENTLQFDIFLPHRKDKEIEHWGMFGKAGMFNWEDEALVELRRIANLDRVRKWTQGGVQYITPSTYVPYDPQGFWVVPAQHVGSKMFLQTGRDRFATNMALLSLKEALATQNPEGIWLTGPRSAWLYDDYGIDAGFYDTRFNTDAALFLLYAYREFRTPAYLQAAVRYADFLVRFAEEHHFKTANGGYLVFDYRQGEPGEPVPTHVSLNHLLTEMNFLYEMYKQTGEIEYLLTAEKMRTAVKDTAASWPREDTGDLWYAYLPDGTYGLLDYPLLTLKDLRYSQELIVEWEGAPDPDFQYLIEVKENYLKKNQLPLHDE